MADEVKETGATQPETEPQGTDWKAMSRMWESRAKENKAAAEELEQLRGEAAAKQGELEKALSEATAERDALSAEKELKALTDKVSEETGVPASVLRGATLEEIQAHADGIRKLLDSTPRYPQLDDAGEVQAKAKATNAQVFGEIFNKALNG